MRPRISVILGPAAPIFASMCNYTASIPNTTFLLLFCLKPESFTGSGEFDDYLQLFNTAALFSGWYSFWHASCRQYFFLRLQRNVLHFCTTLSPEQQNDYDLLVDDFRQNYTTNVGNLKARLKEAKQQAGQDMTIFLCKTHILARRTYLGNPHQIDQIVLTSFLERLKNSTLRRDLWKTKPPTADEDLSPAIELDPFLALERRNNAPSGTPMTSSVNQVAASNFQTATVDELVRTLRKEIKILKTWNNRRKDSVERHCPMYNPIDQNWNRSDARDQTRTRYDFSERKTEISWLRRSQWLATPKLYLIFAIHSIRGGLWP